MVKPHDLSSAKIYYFGPHTEFSRGSCCPEFRLFKFLAYCFVNHTAESIAFEETEVHNTLTGKPGSCNFVHDCVRVRACNGSTYVKCIGCKMEALLHTEWNIKQIICHASEPGLFSPNGT
jgi:hypothetical protein